MNKILVSPSPHVHSSVSTRTLMRDVVIALVPTIIASLLYYGWAELNVIAVSVISCVLLEWAITKYLMKGPKTIGDLSAVVTGLLLSLNVPAGCPWWVIFIGAVVSIGVAKLTFGGLGQNIFNPAITGRVFLLISFPTYMTKWPDPGRLGQAWGFGVDAVSCETPLSMVKEGLERGLSLHEIYPGGLPYEKLLFINIGGSAGELCAFALIAGFIYLLARKVIRPHITLSILLTVFVVSGIFWLADSEQFTDPVFNILSGGVLLGAIFMATDYVTSPMSDKGGIIYGVGIGLLTVLIRFFGSYPEGVSFSILIMNAVVPLINRYCHDKKYGRA